MRFSNPDCVHPPAGPYSHVASVSAGAELVFLSGQIGMRPDGTVPAELSEQADLAFANVVALLDANGLQADDIVRLGVYLVAGQDGAVVRDARLKHLGSHRPVSTTVYVSQLVNPDWLVEVEAVAAKPAGA